MSTRRPFWSRPGRLALLVLALGLVALNTTCTSPLVEPPLTRASAPPVVDDDLALARRHAPWVLHAADVEAGRQDLPAPVDFDGNLRGDDNWESFPRHELLPTVYYAVLSTPTHHFLTYHLFHPRDWEPVRLGLHLTHENDGENLQVVVERASGRVVLLLAQAHYRSRAHAVVGAGFAAGEEDLHEPPLLLDADGRPDPDGTHPAVFVESHGHGIYSASDACAEVTVAADGCVRFEDGGYVLRPARPGEALTEPDHRGGPPAPYGLQSTWEVLWPGVADGSLLGEGGLLDGTVDRTTRGHPTPVPRYYEADRLSGPFGPDRGIAPFALSFGFGTDEVGELFFDPAAAYPRRLGVPEGWSLEYERLPYAAP